MFIFLQSSADQKQYRCKVLERQQNPPQLLTDTGFGVSLKPQTTTALYLKHICSQWQAPASRKRTFATKFSSSSVLFPLRVMLQTQWLRGLTKCLLSHYGAQITARSFMLWLTLKTMPSAYYQESDFYSNSQRINTPGGFLFPQALKQRQSAESGPFISIYICIWKHSHMRRRGIIVHLNQCFSPYRPPALRD